MQYEMWFQPLRVWINEEKQSRGTLSLYAVDFAEAGFIMIETNRVRNWEEVHNWLESRTTQHYTWTGSKFWFSNEDLANAFDLRFGN